MGGSGWEMGGWWVGGQCNGWAMDATTTATKTSAKAILDMSADDGVGNTTDSGDEEEEERVYDEEQKVITSPRRRTYR